MEVSIKKKKSEEKAVTLMYINQEADQVHIYWRIKKSKTFSPKYFFN